jgi:hypothetical protein
MKHNELFFKDFNEMMSDRRAHYANDPRFQLMELPIPAMPGVQTGNIGVALCLIKGVKEPFFDALNNEVVTLVGKTTLTKRQPSPEGGWRTDANGNPLKIQVPVPNDCVAVISEKNIKLRRTLEDGKQYVASGGYKYVDYFDNNSGKRKFIYIIPRDCVYRLNTCALILTFNIHRSFYRRYKLALQNGSYIYMYVVPYKRRTDNQSYRILGVKAGCDFQKEVYDIISLWMNYNAIFNLNYTKLTEPVRGINDLGIEISHGPISEGDFISYTVSLAQEKENESNAVFNTD